MNAHAILRCTRLIFTRPAVEQLGEVVARG
jgi:hypothetical protein